MEIDSLKTQLGNLLALHRDDDANEDDIVFATFDYMRKAHNVAQMLLLEGRFQELQRCLHLCQAAFGEASNVCAGVADHTGSHAPLLSFVGASAEGAGVEEGQLADQRKSRASTVSPLHTSMMSADGTAAPTAGAAVSENGGGPGDVSGQRNKQERCPFIVLHSDEDRRVFAALQSRTTQLQKQLEAAMRVRRGRDTEYYMQRLGLREKGAAPPALKEDSVKVHVQRLPAFQQVQQQQCNTNVANIHRFHTESISVSSLPNPAHASISPVVPPRSHRPSWQVSVMLPPRTGSGFHVSPLPAAAAAATIATPGAVFGSSSTPTSVGALVPVHATAPLNLLINGTATAIFDPDAPEPPERGVSFGNQVHFSRGKGRIELPPLVTSDRLFCVSHNNAMSVQHTVFGSSAAVITRQKSSLNNSSTKREAKAGEDEGEGGDFGLRAVEALFGAEGAADEIPLYLCPVPEDVQLWSSDSDSSSSQASSSYVFDGAATSLRMKRASLPPPPPLSSKRTLIDDPPLVSAVSSARQEDDEDNGVFTAPRRTHISSHFLATAKNSMLSSTPPSASSLIRRGIAVEPSAVAGSATDSPAAALASGNDSTLFNSSQQRHRTAADNNNLSLTPSLPTRPIPPTWMQLMHARKRSTDSHGMSAASISAFNASASRTLVSVADSTLAATITTCTGVFDQQVLAGPEQRVSPAVLEDAKAVEAARQTTQYVMSSFKAQRSRSDQALQRCEALTISRLPYSARHATAAGAAAAPSVVLGSDVATPHNALSLTPHPNYNNSGPHGGEWTPVSQLLPKSSSSHVPSSMPSSPGIYATSASPLLTTASTTGGGNGEVVTTAPAATPSFPVQTLQTLSPAAEQQLREVRAAQEQQLATAARGVRDLEARWISQHRQLQTQASMPALENIAEWRKRRGRWQQQPQSQPQSHNKGGKDGGRERRHGQSRHRARAPPPFPSPVAKVPTSSSPTSAAPPSRYGGARGDDASFGAPPLRSPSRSPSLLSTAPTRESRLNSYNLDEGSGPSSHCSSDVARRPSLEALRLESNVGAPMLVTPVDHQSLSLVGLNRNNSGSGTNVLRPSRRSSAQTLSLPPAALQLSPPITGGARESVTLSVAGVAAGTTTDIAGGSSSVDSGEGAAWAMRGWSEKRMPELSDLLGLFSCDHDGRRSSGEEKINKGGSASECDEEVDRDDAATSHLGRTPSFRSELRSKLAETVVYAQRGLELVKVAAAAGAATAGEDDSGVVGQERNSERTPYTYHPAVDAIISERRRCRETLSSGVPIVPKPESTEDTLAAWQRTLLAVTADAKQPHYATGIDEWTSFSRASLHRCSSQDTLGYIAGASNATTWWPRPTKCTKTEISAPSFPPLQQQRWKQLLPVPPLEAPPLRRHGIRSGAVDIRTRCTKDILSAAIRDASEHVREEDLVRPAWLTTNSNIGGTGFITNTSAGSGNAMALLPQPPIDSSLTAAAAARQQGQPPFLVDFPNVFAAGGGAAVSPVGASPTTAGRRRSNIDDAQQPSRQQQNNRRSLTSTNIMNSNTTAAAAGAIVSRTPDTSLSSVPSAPTTTSTPVLLSLTAKALTPQSLNDDRYDQVPPTTLPNLRETGANTTNNVYSNRKDRTSFLLRPLDGSPLPSLGGVSLRQPSIFSGASSAAELAAASHDAYRHLHIAYRVSEELRTTPEWTTVATAVLGRCLPLCIAAVRLQRWWRRRLARCELKRRQQKVGMWLLLQQRRDTAALCLQRQLRVHWARQVTAHVRAAVTAATEQRVAAENPAMTALTLTRLNPVGSSTGSGYAAFVDTFNGVPGVFAGSTTSSRQSNRTPNRYVGAFAGGEERGRANFGDVQGCNVVVSNGGVMHRSSSQLSAPLQSATRPSSSERGGPVRASSRLQRGGGDVSSKEASLLNEDVLHHTMSTKDSWGMTARRSVSQNEYPSFRPSTDANDTNLNASVVTGAPSNVSNCAQPKERGSTLTTAAFQTISGAEVVPSRPLSFAATNEDDDVVKGSGHCDNISNEKQQLSPRSSSNVSATNDKKTQQQQQRTPSPTPIGGTEHDAPKRSSAPRQTLQDPVSAARRIQRWSRRHSAEEMALLSREAAVLATVVTGRAPLTAVRDAFRPVGLSRNSVSDSAGKGGKGGDTYVKQRNPSLFELADTDGLNSVADTAGMGELLAKCTGDVYKNYLCRSAAAREQGDYKTPLERVSLRALQRIREDREHEEKQKLVLQERQQRMRKGEQQRRERQLVEAAKLLQRVGRGLRWRRWLRERQCRDLHYRATHTLDLLSQTDTLSAHAVKGPRRGGSRGAHAGFSTISAEEQRICLSGGWKVTAHVMARLRTMHPEWFGLNVDHESAAWVVDNATPAQQAAIIVVQSFVSAFASRTATFVQYQHACARSIQLTWRAHQQRRRRNRNFVRSRVAQ